MSKIRISIILDNPKSWMVSHVSRLIASIKRLGHEVVLIHDHEAITSGEIAIFLSCEKIISKSNRSKNKFNLVVHESDLPLGKGWSPVTWQVLEGKNKIPICLFEAADKVDSGNVYYRDYFSLEGHELIDEIREKQAEKTFELILKFIVNFPNVQGTPQKGKESFCRKRNPADSEIDPKRPFAEQFNLLRVVDNDRYPAFFYHNGKKYILKISMSD